MGTHLERALVLFEQSRHDLAEDQLRQELAGDPNSALAHSLLGLCLSERHEFQHATSEARMAVHLAPDMPFSHYALAKVLYDRDHIPEAQATIEEALRLDPEDPDYYALLGPSISSNGAGRWRLPPRRTACAWIPSTSAAPISAPWRW